MPALPAAAAAAKLTELARERAHDGRLAANSEARVTLLTRGFTGPGPQKKPASAYSGEQPKRYNVLRYETLEAPCSSRLLRTSGGHTWLRPFRLAAYKAVSAEAMSS